MINEHIKGDLLEMVYQEELMRTKTVKGGAETGLVILINAQPIPEMQDEKLEYESSKLFPN